MTLTFIQTFPLLHSPHRPLQPRLHPPRFRLPSRPTKLQTPSLSTATPSQPKPSSVQLTIFKTNLSVPGRLLLSFVPLLWATFILSAKLLYTIPKALPPSLFNAARLSISALFFLPTLRHTFRPTNPHPRAALLLAGLELGALMFCANAAQIAGLRYTQASRAAFLTQLSTIFVPLSATALGIEPLSAPVATGALCALLGVGLLTLAVPTVAASSRIGDGLEVLAAVFVTAYVLRVSRHAKRNSEQAGGLVAVKVVTQAVLSGVWLVVKAVLGGQAAAKGLVGNMVVPWTVKAVVLNVALVVWAGVFVSAATSWMQTKGQTAVPASEAAILYAAQPLWASVFAVGLLGESLGVAGMFGAAFIVVGTVVSGLEGGDKARG